MKNRILICLSILCFLVLALGGCIGGQQRPSGFSGVTAHDGILYLGSTDGKVMAVNPSARDQNLEFPSSSDGEWSFIITTPSKGMSCGSSSAPDSIYGIPVVVNDLACVGTYSGRVFIVSPEARSQNLDFPQARSGEWIYPRSEDVIGPIVGSPVVSDDTIYICSSDGRVYALDATYGDEKWKSEQLGEKLWITPVVEQETVYVSTFDGHIYALSAEDGSLLPWDFKAEAGFVSSPTLYDGTIFVGSFDRNLYAVDISDAKLLWSFPGGNWFWAAPVVKNSVVYAGCLDGKVYALDSRTGNKLWEFDAGSPIASSPALTDEALVVACESGMVYIVNIETGIGKQVGNPDDPQNVDRATIDAVIHGSLCTLDGIAYIRAQDNVLYVIDVGKERLIWKVPLTIK